MRAPALTTCTRNPRIFQNMRGSSRYSPPDDQEPLVENTWLICNMRESSYPPPAAAYQKAVHYSPILR